MTDPTNSAGLARAATRRQIIISSAAALGGMALGEPRARASDDEISHTAEAIHQEVVFQATCKRVYDALVDAKQFNEVVQLSGAVKSGMVPANKPPEISREVGGAFTLYAAVIVGRHIEMVPGERLVQAWRVADWHPGVYSIARFELAEQDSSTKLVFDHTGFPQGMGQHLAAGWKANYWEPLAKYLAGST